LSHPLSLLDPRAQRFEKIWNTFIRVRLPWRRTLDASYWGKRGRGESHGPEQYVELQESSRVLLDEVAACVSDPKAKILDLGCNVGRHLGALHKRGFANLYGVDIQQSALEQMGKVFPDMAAVAHIEHATFQDYLPKIPDRFFDVVFTHGATVELVPPSFPVCRQMARTTEKSVVMVIHENGHAFPRLWETEFLRTGFLLAKILRPVHRGSEASLFVFHRMIP